MCSTNVRPSSSHAFYWYIYKLSSHEQIIVKNKFKPTLQQNWFVIWYLERLNHCHYHNTTQLYYVKYSNTYFSIFQNIYVITMWLYNVCTYLRILSTHIFLWKGQSRVLFIDIFPFSKKYSNTKLTHIMTYRDTTLTYYILTCF